MEAGLADVQRTIAVSTVSAVELGQLSWSRKREVDALADEAAVELVRHPFGGVAPLLPRERPVQFLVIDRDVPLLGEVARHVTDVEADEGSVEVRRVAPVGHRLEDLHAVELVAVDPGGQEYRGRAASPSTTVTGISTGSPRYVSLIS